MGDTRPAVLVSGPAPHSCVDWECPHGACYLCGTCACNASPDEAELEGAFDRAVFRHCAREACSQRDAERKLFGQLFLTLAALHTAAARERDR